MPTESFFNKNLNKIISDRIKNAKRIDKNGNVVALDIKRDVNVSRVDLSERYPPSVLKTLNFQANTNNYKNIKASHPVLMMPIRLETRFYLGSKPQLKIRVMPDDFMIDDHEPRLSTVEYETGRIFWEEYKKLGSPSSDDESFSQLWSWFVAQVDTDRATMIAYQSQKAIPASNLRSPEESNIAKSLLLPDRWIAVGYNGSERVLEGYSKPIKHDTAFSPDLKNAKEVANDLSVDENIKWMFNYDKAHDKGMAITLDLDNKTKNGIEELYVLGIKTKNPNNLSQALTPIMGSKLIESTLHKLRLSKGAGFVPQGMPTNNTEETESGWSAFDPDTDAMWRRTFEELPEKALNIVSERPTTPGSLTPTEKIPEHVTDTDKNALVLGNAFGLTANSYALRQYEFREGYEQKLMSAMNEALWPITYGELLTSMLAYEDTPSLNKSNRDWLKNWFKSNVYGGASLPTIRVNETPYGVLPVQSFGHMKSAKMADQKGKVLFDLIQKILPFLMGEKADQLTSMTDNPQNTNDIGEIFLDLMSRHPNPVQFMLQDFSFDEWKITNWYELLKAGITDTDFNPYAERVDEITKADLPKLKNKKFKTLQEQRDAFNEAKGKIQIIYNNSYKTELDKDHAFYEEWLYDKQALEAITSLINHMLETIDAHMARGSAFEFLEAPANIFKGVLTRDHKDPNLLFCRYDTDLSKWPEDMLAVIDKGDNTVTPQTYITYLQTYLDSLLDDKVTVGPSPFPDQNKPLLYHLLYTAISRTSVEYDEGIQIIVDVLDTVKKVDGDLLAKRFERADENSIRDLSATISGFKASQPASGKQKVLGMTLKRTNATELKTAAKTIRAQASKNPANKAAMLDLAKSLETFSGNPQNMKAVKKVPTGGTSIAKDLGDLRKVLDILKDTPWDQLELLLQQSLGLAGWRLDAWYSSFHTARLKQLRTTRPQGLQLGAYGWVHDLKPRHLDQGSKEVSQGYIHTPSLNHAKTAAVLRAGWTAYQSENSHEALSVDLSSERVRIASWLFDAVRRGQDIGDALGYRFERDLHEEGLDYWIMPVRQAVLAYSQEEFDPLSPVVDGLELLKLWNKGKDQEKFKIHTHAHFKGTKPNPQEVKSSIEKLEIAIDAMGDTAIADSVHALVQGNPVRAGSNLAAINRGEVPPPEMNFANTERRGRTFTHKVMLLNHAEPQSFGWFRNEKEFSSNMRASADPDMERQAAALLGDISNLRFEIGYKKEGEIIHRGIITLEDINENPDFALGALDCLCMTAENSDAKNSALEEWITLFFDQNRPDKFKDKSFIPVILDEEDAKKGISETDRTRVWLANWRETLLKSRPLRPVDFIFSEDAEANKGNIIVNVGEIEKRAKNTLVFFKKKFDELNGLLPAPTEEIPEPVGEMEVTKLFNYLRDLAKLGMPFAIPRMLEEVDENLKREILYRQLWGVQKGLNKRVTEAEKTSFDLSLATEDRINNARTIIQALLGKTMLVVPTFRPANIVEIIMSLSDSAKRIGSGETINACSEWMEKMQYVQPEIRSLSEALLVHDLENKGQNISFTVGQWPHVRGEPWSAITPKKLSERSYTSIMSVNADKLNLSRLKDEKEQLCGLFIDEVIERLPEVEEDTGVALHFDGPNTEPPQTMLLAMAPEGKAWDFDLMVDTLRDTFEWSRLRTIDDIPFLSNYMPASFASGSLFNLVPPEEDQT